MRSIIFIRRILCLGGLLLFSFLLFEVQAQTGSTPKPITLEDIWQKGTFASKGVPGFNFQKDGVHFTRLEGTTIGQYDLRTGERSGILFDAATVKSEFVGWQGAFDGYSFSADDSKILLTTNSNPIFRWSTEADFFVFDQKTKKLSQLYEDKVVYLDKTRRLNKQRYATFSPDGSKVGFVLKNDLYFKDLVSGMVTRVTNDGKQNEIINGASDWVYEEEFELVRAFQWSPDGQRLAYLRFDEREVPEMTMDMFRGGPYPEPVTFKYPKVGEKNSIVTAHIYDLLTSKTVHVNIPDRERKSGRLDDYLPRIVWTPSGQLCLSWMNRHQNTQRLLLADPVTGNCKVLHQEKNRYYLDLHDVIFLSDGSGFVMQSEKSGFNHLYKFDMAGKEVAKLTKGDFDVTAFYGIDEKNGKVYYQASSKTPMARELFETNLKGKKTKKINKPAGTNGAQWSSTFDYFVHTFSTANTPPQYTVYDRKGKALRALEQNTELRSMQTEYGTTPIEFFKVPIKTPSSSAGGREEELELNGWMIKPTAPEFQNQKLPVLMFVYGGPGSQQVTDAWKGANYWWFQMLAQQGYVVACVDNRGTGARGEEFKKMTYKQLGHYEVMDQIEAAKHLGSLDFVDAGRIGIFGWSYGGYMSTNCILKGNDVFEAAIAVAPVTNWKWYDSVYTERYMQTHEENELGYEENSPTNFAEQLEGSYLLVHGLADDNVHFQNTAEMANELIAKNKQFDTMIYPNRNHGIGGDNAKIHLYTLMTKFLNEKLKNKQGEVKVVRP
ncbi:MAG: DPP IV N-terminal domain-containing protein [Saprospiraceae bacterium]|nr:DPP IV N-terminal domain-containing protein [Saprospiraceae bacterium]